MIKTMKRIACILLAFCMLLAVVGCGKAETSSTYSDEVLGMEVITGNDSGNSSASDDDSTDPGTTSTPSNLEINQSSKGEKVVNNCYVAGYPIAKDKVTIKIMAVDYSEGIDYNTMPFTKYIEQRFNLDIEFEKITSAQVDEKISLACASGKMPDMFWGTGLAEDSLIAKYNNEGRIIDLTDYIEDYAPNIKKLFKDYPTAEYLSTSSSGKIYKFPFVREDTDMWEESLFINKTWLTKLGLSMPKNTQDLLKVLRAFKNNDPNGNGKKDEIPLVFASDVPRGWYGMFGRSTYANKSKDASGKIYFVPTTTEYKNAISFAADLYSEGLLYNQDMRNVNYAKVRSMIESSVPTVGIVNAYSYDDIMSAETFVKHYTIMPVVDGTGKGAQTWSYRDIEALWPNWGMITSACKYPEICVRLVDYFYSLEGSVVAEYGPPNEKLYWYYNSKGEPVLTNNNINNKNISPWHAIPRYMSSESWDFFTNEKKYSDANVEKAEKAQVALVEQLYGDLPIYHNYNYLYTDKELETMEEKVSSNISMTALEWRCQFIYGKKNIDSEWASYVDAMNRLGASTWMSLEQAASDRMNKWIKANSK